MLFAVSGIIMTPGSKPGGTLAQIRCRTTIALFMNMKAVLTRRQAG
jgi:hypothetical protein